MDYLVVKLPSLIKFNAKFAVDLLKLYQWLRMNTDDVFYIVFESLNTKVSKIINQDTDQIVHDYYDNEDESL